MVERETFAYFEADLEAFDFLRQFNLPPALFIKLVREKQRVVNAIEVIEYLPDSVILRLSDPNYG